MKKNGWQKKENEKKSQKKKDNYKDKKNMTIKFKNIKKNQNKF